MNNALNLKELERKAFRSTYQDGLWDIYLGLIVACMGLFITRPEEGYGPWNLVWMTATFLVSYMLFWMGKRYITVPRLGQVTYGPARKKKGTTMAVVLGIIILLQIAFVLFTVGGWLNPDLGAKISAILPGGDIERLAVSAVASLFLGLPMLLVVYFMDFPRGLYIVVLMALAVFLMIYVNQPLYPLLLGLLIILPGVALLIRFLRKYPLHRTGGRDGE